MIWISSNNFIWSIGSGSVFTIAGILRKKLGVGVHQAVAHRGPVIEAMIDIAGARLLLVVARDQLRIEGGDRAA